AAEHIVHAEKIAENILEVREDRLVEIGLEAAIAEARVAVTVVDLALLRIGENAVGLRRAAKILLGFVLVFRIAVRVMLQREFAIGGLDLIARSIALDAENFVVVQLG